MQRFQLNLDSYTKSQQSFFMAIKALFSAVVLLVATLQIATAQTSAPKSDTLTTIVGKWAGSFEGSSSGKFELVVNQDTNQKLTGQVIMVGDDGNRHPIDLKTIVWQNGKLNATYTDPTDGDEVSFTGSFTNPTLKGTWKADGGQSVGTWQTSRDHPLARYAEYVISRYKNEHQCQGWCSFFIFIA